MLAPASFNTFAMHDPTDDSRSSSVSSPAPADNEESDFFRVANDSQSSLGIGTQAQDGRDKAEDSSCPIHELPSEILISVFSKLNTSSDLFRCILTCKRWARNTVNLLWYRPACVSPRSLQLICQTLVLEHPYFSYKDYIRRLNLSTLAGVLDDRSVAPLSVCHRIERITLTSNDKITDVGLVALVQNNASLHSLDVSGARNITGDSVNALAGSCKRLQGLNISSCIHISNDSLINLAQSCRYIKRLKLNDCVQVNEDVVLAFANNCPNILEIDLHYCRQVGNSSVTSLLARVHALRELRLIGCELIDDGAFLSLPPNRTFEGLRVLDLTSCIRLTDLAVRKIVEVAPRLRNLILQKCRHITDAAVYSISRLGKNLHFIHLGHCGNLTDDAVKVLVRECSRIRYIDLGCCALLTDESIKRLANLPKLKRIGLVKCHQITDASILALASTSHKRPRLSAVSGSGNIYMDYPSFSNLERVHLSYCVSLTLKGIYKLMIACPRLTHLSLTGVAAFQADDFNAFGREAPQEFTPHQRSLFCVFSGDRVSHFREFLSAAPKYSYLREETSTHHHSMRRHTHTHTSLSIAQVIAIPINNPLDINVVDFDDQEADMDDEEIFEGDASDQAREDLSQRPVLPHWNFPQTPVSMPPLYSPHNDHDQASLSSHITLTHRPSPLFPYSPFCQSVNNPPSLSSSDPRASQFMVDTFMAPQAQFSTNISSRLLLPNLQLTAEPSSSSPNNASNPARDNDSIDSF